MWRPASPGDNCRERKVEYGEKRNGKGGKKGEKERRTINTYSRRRAGVCRAAQGVASRMGWFCVWA